MVQPLATDPLIAGEEKSEPVLDSASYRDPGGFVFHRNGRVYRAIRQPAIDDYLELRASGLMERLISRGRLIPTTPADCPRSWRGDVAAVVEHEKLPVISYPYEWSFEALKAAALLHIDLHLEALEAGFTLCDGNAYNIQFRGARPVFIDLLSIRRHEEGSYWDGHRQFCEHFLNPLLLGAALDIPHNAHLRGSPEGIPCDALARLLPLRWMLRWPVFSNVLLPAWFQRRARIDRTQAEAQPGKGLSAATLRGLLLQLRSFIDRLRRRGHAGIWSEYACTNTYNAEAYEAKRGFVARFTSTHAPGVVLDLGCNTGDFAVTAIEAGARSVIGLEGDAGALDIAFRRAQANDLPFLPLYQDLVNPSSSQGWNGKERLAIQDRIAADAALALAVVHHMVLARNVPVAWVLDWIVGLAPVGVIEFVPPDDPMAKRLLGGRSPQSLDYSEPAFMHHLSQRATVVDTLSLPGSSRRLIAFARKSAPPQPVAPLSPWAREGLAAS